MLSGNTQKNIQSSLLYSNSRPCSTEGVFPQNVSLDIKDTKLLGGK